MSSGQQEAGSGNDTSDWRQMSDATREREYSPSSVIGGNYQPFIDAYVNDSETARAEAGNVVECRYGPGDAQTLDLAMPQSTANNKLCPLLVFVHGGYWQELSKRESFFAATDCLAQGTAFAALDYTLAPRATIDQIVEECRRALAWLHQSAHKYGFDPQQIVVAGSSAGAHLAAMCALPQADATDRNNPDHAPAGAVLVSGIFDLEPLIGTSVNDALGLDTDGAIRNSPIRHDLVGFPPTVLVWGEMETNEFKRQSRAFGHKLSDAGTEVQTQEIAMRNHFDIVMDLTDNTAPLGRAVNTLIRNMPASKA